MGAVASPRHRIAEGSIQPFQHGCFQEEILLLGRLPVEDLLHQIIQYVMAATGEGFDETL